MSLKTIKAKRVQTYTQVYEGGSTKARILRRYWQLRPYHSPIAILAYFAWRIILKIAQRIISLAWGLISPRSNSFEIQLEALGYPTSENAASAASPLIFALGIHGGIGDALIAARFIRDLQAYLGADLQFDIFFRSPKAIEPFFKNIKGFRKSLDIIIYNNVVKFYSFSIKGCQNLEFVKEHIKIDKLFEACPKIIDIYSDMERLKSTYEVYYKCAPSLDGAFADLISAKGYKRYSYQQDILGISYAGHTLDIDLKNDLLEGLSIPSGQFITIHDGWDETNKLLKTRPTKTVPKKFLADFVVALKAKVPELKIIQIGGKTGEDIPGVDLNLKNKLSFEQSTALLARAQLHFDCESGLVHLAASLGVRSIVLFGPTSLDWFGYPENINVAPGQCGNCWWSTDIWLAQCPLGYEPPVCTSSYDLSAVVEQAITVLNNKGDVTSPARIV